MDKLAGDQRSRVARLEKELGDYQLQVDRPFEHEERLKQLLARQAELAAYLDLDKGDQQGAPSAEDQDRADIDRSAPTATGHEEVARRAAEYMRSANTAVRELPIKERVPPQTGSITGTAVATSPTHVAVATAPNSFVVCASSSLDHDVKLGDRLSLRFRQGHAVLDNARDRGR